MKTVLVTGARGFIGRNLVAQPDEINEVHVLGFDLNETEAQLRAWISQTDVIFHLAGVNRAPAESQFEEGNRDFTGFLCDAVHDSNRSVHIVFSSSIQAVLSNPYGQSKNDAEVILKTFGQETCNRISIFRLKNVFGKWCRPNYNSVVATFCHSIAHDLPITISDPDRELELVYVDDVVDAFIAEMEAPSHRATPLVEPDPIPSCTLTLGDLADRFRFFRDMQDTLQVPDLSSGFNKQLYATYLSYVPPDRWEYGTEIRSDERGNLAELVKSRAFGQIFVSRTQPGVTRGNHYHHTKTEKFIVVAGRGLIRFRQIHGSEIIDVAVRGEDYRIVDIPPGYTHSITNTGSGEMITLFWASEPFDPDRPDTYYLPVDPE